MLSSHSKHLYFNPHRHKGGDLTFPEEIGRRVISILTATRAVTRAKARKHLQVTNFNPHRHKGGDQQVAKRRYAPNNFNPHRHKGGDMIPSPISALPTDFNPHRHKGGDGSEPDSVLVLPDISILTATRAVTT